MKVISKQGKNDKKHLNMHLQTFEREFKRESEFLKNMNHPHIVKMVHSKMGGGGDRPTSGESSKSNKSNNSSKSDE